MTMTKKHRQEIILCILLALVVGLGCALPGHAKKKKKKETKVDLVWPLPPDTPRIRFLEMYTTNFDIEPLKKHSWLDKAIGKPNPNLAELFEKPAGVAIDSQDRILIASLQKSTVYVLDPEKREILRLRGGRGIGLVNPLGVVVDDNDNFFVSDPVLGSVLKFDSEGNLLATLGRNDGMKNPTYMAVDESRRRLFVVDSHLHQVLVYNLDTLMLIATVGERGMGDGQFNYPVGIGVALPSPTPGVARCRCSPPTSNSSVALANRERLRACSCDPREWPSTARATSMWSTPPSTTSRFLPPRARCYPDQRPAESSGADVPVPRRVLICFPPSKRR
jgi:hypothetical protein